MIDYPRSPADADPVLGPLLDGVHAYVCAVLSAAGRPVCEEACCVVPGDTQPPADRCGCECGGGAGQAWVRWAGDEPVRAGGGKGGGRDCPPLHVVHVVEAGVYRCVSVMGDGGEPPSCAERTRDALGLVQDRSLLMQALKDCHVLRDRRWELQRLEPTAAQGGCAGVLVQITVERKCPA